jgi:hypothetical protein
MAKTRRERQDEKRAERLENMRKQIACGELTVRQMTLEERERWDEHSAASVRLMAPAERARRGAEIKKRARVREFRRTRSGDT